MIYIYIYCLCSFISYNNLHPRTHFLSKSYSDSNTANYFGISYSVPQTHRCICPIKTNSSLKYRFIRVCDSVSIIYNEIMILKHISPSLGVTTSLYDLKEELAPRDCYTALAWWPSSRTVSWTWDMALKLTGITLFWLELHQSQWTWAHATVWNFHCFQRPLTVPPGVYSFSEGGR